MVYAPRNRTVPPASTQANIRSFKQQAAAGKRPQIWSPTAPPRQGAVPAARQIISLATAAAAGRLATADQGEFVSPDMRLVVTPSRGGEFDLPLADGTAYFPRNGEAPSGQEGMPMVSPATLAGIDGRAGDILAAVQMRRTHFTGIVVPLCTPASPAMLSFYAGSMRTLLDGGHLGPETTDAIRQQLLGLWTDALRSLADSIEFVREFIPAGTKAWGVSPMDVEARHVSRVLSQTKDPRTLATWVNMATKALSTGRQEFSEYLG